MPIDRPEATATDNPRRTFLARAAVGGALVTAGSVAGTILQAVPAGAQTPDPISESEELDDGSYAIIVTPLELAAVQVYDAALRVEGLRSEVVDDLRLFQTHHQTVADTIGALYEGPDPLVADPILTASAPGTDEASILASLTALEEQLSGTHLSALGAIADSATARTAAQVLAVQGQHAVALTVLAGGDLEAVTPAVVTPGAAVTLDEDAATEVDATSGDETTGTEATETEATADDDGTTDADSTTTTGEAGN